MGHGRGKSCSAPETVPVQIPDMIVSGVTVPDCTGNYFENGEFGNRPLYTRADEGFHILWSITLGAWIISAVLDDMPDDFWLGGHPDPPGEYTGVGAYEGIAIVAEAP